MIIISICSHPNLMTWSLPNFAFGLTVFCRNKNGSGLISENRITAKQIFHRIWIKMENPVMKSTPIAIQLSEELIPDS